MARPAAHLQLGAEVHSMVHTLEFDAAAVRAMCEEDRCVVTVVGNRLQSTRTRLLDLYGPAAAGPGPDRQRYSMCCRRRVVSSRSARARIGR